MRGTSQPGGTSPGRTTKRKRRHILNMKTARAYREPTMYPISQLQSLNPTTADSRRKCKEGVEHMKFAVRLYAKRSTKEGYSCMSTLPMQSHG